jgi:hypothetical protein
VGEIVRWQDCHDWDTFGEATDFLRAILHSLLDTEERRVREEEGEVLELLYGAIADRFPVEDWTNPEKGITELEAHLNALATPTEPKEEE